jgi:hypothetical protein
LWLWAVPFVLGFGVLQLTPFGMHGPSNHDFASPQLFALFTHCGQLAAAERIAEQLGNEPRYGPGKP